MRAALQGGAARLATCWILTRKDGRRLGFTDHDRPLGLDGVVCDPSSGLSPQGASGRLGQAGEAQVLGTLAAEAVTDADLAAGLYDGARVQAWRVDWSDPTQRVSLGEGTIARLRRDGQGWRATLAGPLAPLQRRVGRAYGRLCDAELGDARCRVDLADPRFAGAACDKRFAICRERFENAANFRGFPDLPGDDFLAAVPAQGEANDGGSRR